MVSGRLVDMSHELRGPSADGLGRAERGVLRIAGARRGGGSISRAGVPAAQLCRGGVQRRGRNDVSPTTLPPARHICELERDKRKGEDLSSSEASGHDPLLKNKKNHNEERKIQVLSG